MKRPRSLSYPVAEEEDSSLTPLIDVVFVVLILFILVAPMVEIDKVTLSDAPIRESVDKFTSSPLRIYVRADNSIWLGNNSITPKDLAATLKKFRYENPTQKPQLYQDKNACFHTYQTVKNAAEGAGYEELEVILNSS